MTKIEFNRNVIFQKIDENVEQIKVGSDVQMKTVDNQAELCVKEKPLDEIPIGKDKITIEMVAPSSVDIGNTEHECPKVKSQKFRGSGM